jgi:hypothetical protein
MFPLGEAPATRGDAVLTGRAGSWDFNACVQRVLLGSSIAVFRSVTSASRMTQGEPITP